MKKVLIGILIGISIILMYLMFIDTKSDKIQIKTKGRRIKRKYVKLKPENYKHNL